MHVMNFDFESWPLRVICTGGPEWFLGSDILRCLRVEDQAVLFDALPDDEKGVGNADALLGLPQAITVNLPGVMRLVIGHGDPVAGRLKEFIIQNVLPAVRRGQSIGSTVDLDVLARKVSIVTEVRTSLGEEAAAALWKQLGLPPISSGSEAQLSRDSSSQREAWRSIAACFGECCEQSSSGQERTPTLCSLYNRWADAAGAPGITLTGFGLAMRHGPYRKRKSGTTWWQGLRIRQDAEERIAARRARSAVGAAAGSD